MGSPLNDPGVRNAIFNQGKTGTEGAAFFWGNIMKGVQDSTKSALTVDSGRRVGAGTFKASKIFYLSS